MRKRLMGGSVGAEGTAVGVGFKLAASVACTRSSSHRSGGQGIRIGSVAAGVGDHWEREEAGGLNEFFEEVAVPKLEH
jgi:hypothetical protein